MLQLKSRLVIITVFSFLLILGGAVYLPGVSGPFLFDDYGNIITNAYLQIHSLDAESLYRAAYSSRSGPLNRPVTMLSFTLNQYFASGAATTTFKATNIAIHIINGLLIFWMLRLVLARLGQLHRNRSIYKPNNQILLAGAIALLWLVHPIQLTSVLYVVQRMTSLASLFMLLAMVCYLKGRLRIVAGASSGLWIIGLGTTGFGLVGLLSKEIVLLLPVFILLLEWVLFRDEKPWSSWHELTPRKKRILASSLVLITVFTLILVVERALVGYENRHFTLMERVFTEGRVLWFYIFLILVPRINEFGLYHDDIPLSTSLITPWTTLPSLFVLAAILVLAVAWRKKHPLLSLGILWFFTGHLLESTILALEITHEHRNYLASLGVLLAVVYLVAYAAQKHGHNKLWAIVPVLAVIFGGVTFLRSTQWSDFNTLTFYEAQHHPESASAQANLGVALYEQKQYEEAMQTMRRASELDEKEQLYLLNMHLIYAKTGTALAPKDKAETLRRLAAYRLSPSASSAFERINSCLSSDCRTLQGDVEAWLKLVLENPPPNADKSYYYYILGRALAGQGKTREALTALHRSFELDRNYLHPLFEIARIHIRLKDFENAKNTLALLRKTNQGNLHPRDQEIEALAENIEKKSPGIKQQRSYHPGQGAHFSYGSGNEHAGYLDNYSRTK